MAEPLDPQSMSNEERAQRLADTSRHMEEVGAELRALSPVDPSGDVAAVIRHLYLITDQHTDVGELTAPSRASGGRQCAT